MAHAGSHEMSLFEATSDDPVPLLRAKGPVYTGIQDCLRIQEHAVTPGPMAKLFGRCPLDAEARTSYATALAEVAIALSRGTGSSDVASNNDISCEPA